MTNELKEILSRSPESWNDTDRATIHAATSPLKDKTVANMTDSERNFVHELFVMYCSHYDIKKRAVAYCVLLAGVPASKIGAIMLCDVTEWDIVNNKDKEIGDAVLGLPVTKLFTPEYLNFVRYLMLNDTPIHIEEQYRTLFVITITTYVLLNRGLIPGVLFTQDRRAKGKKDEAKPPMSTATVGRILRNAANDLGFGGIGQHLQFHRLRN